MAAGRVRWLPGADPGDRELAFDQLVPNLSECKFFGLVSGGDGPIKIELAARVHIVGLFDVVDETKWDRLPPMSRTLQDKYRQIAETRSPLTRTAAKDPHRLPPMSRTLWDRLPPMRRSGRN